MSIRIATKLNRPGLIISACFGVISILDINSLFFGDEGVQRYGSLIGQHNITGFLLDHNPTGGDDHCTFNIY